MITPFEFADDEDHLKMPDVNEAELRDNYNGLSPVEQTQQNELQQNQEGIFPFWQVNLKMFSPTSRIVLFSPFLLTRVNCTILCMFIALKNSNNNTVNETVNSGAAHKGESKPKVDQKDHLPSDVAESFGEVPIENDAHVLEDELREAGDNEVSYSGTSEVSKY